MAQVVEFAGQLNVTLQNTVVEGLDRLARPQSKDE